MVLKGTDFEQFLCGEAVVVLKGCGGLERTNLGFLTVSMWEGVVVLKELILTVSNLGRVWWS